MPLATTLETHEEKSQYLKALCQNLYKGHFGTSKIKNDTEVLDILLDILVSGIGSLTNPTRPLKVRDRFQLDLKLLKNILGLRLNIITRIWDCEMPDWVSRN